MRHVMALLSFQSRHGRACISSCVVQEQELLEYLASARDLAGRPLYDAVHALRLARERGRLRASVALFCEVRLRALHHLLACACAAHELAPCDGEVFGAAAVSLQFGRPT